MDRKFLFGLLMGILVGVIFVIYGNQFFLRASKAAFLLLSGGILVVLIILISFYLFRKKILQLIGLNVQVEKKINESSSDLISAIIDQKTTKVKESARELTNVLIDKLVEIQSRVWLFRVSIALFAVLGGLFATLITMNQNEIIQNQNKLIEEQGHYLINMDRPFLNVNTYSLEWNEKDDEVKADVNLHLMNIGGRPAVNLQYDLQYFEYIESEQIIKLLYPTINEVVVNPLAPNGTLQINSLFNKANNGETVIVSLRTKYSDGLDPNKMINSNYVYKIPPPVKDPNIPTGLMGGNRIHKELVDRYFTEKDEL